MPKREKGFLEKKLEGLSRAGAKTNKAAVLGAVGMSGAPQGPSYSKHAALVSQKFGIVRRMIGLKASGEEGRLVGKKNQGSRNLLKISSFLQNELRSKFEMSMFAPPQYGDGIPVSDPLIVEAEKALSTWIAGNKGNKKVSLAPRES